MTATPLRCCLVGTDTGVGKTRVLALLTHGLRALGRRVWLHKPVACGEWADGQAEDGRVITPLVGDGQDPTSACPRQWPEACSPHLAAQAAGDRVTTADLLASLAALEPVPGDLLVEGAGGILAPLASDDGGILDLLGPAHLHPLVVTRPHLGTLNHTRLTVAQLRAAGHQPLGLVINDHEAVGNGVAISTAASELARLCACPVLARIPHGCPGDAGPQAVALAESVLARA